MLKDLKTAMSESSLVLLTVLMVHNGLGTVGYIGVPSSAEDINTGKQYILFTHQTCWNAARQACRSIGGNLAKLHTGDLLEKVRTAATDPTMWEPHWSHAWTGLHRDRDLNLIFDDDGCSSFNLGICGLNVFHHHDDYDQLDDKFCYRIQQTGYRLERKDCKDDKTAFICQRKIPSGHCPYRSVATSMKIVFDTSRPCEEICDEESSCYATGIARVNDHTRCVLLMVPAGSDELLEKTCDPEFSVNHTITDDTVCSDITVNSPTICTSNIGYGASNSWSISSTNTSSASAIPELQSSFSTATTSLTCSPEVITVSQPVVNVTITETITDAQSVLETLSCSASVVSVSVTETVRVQNITSAISCSPVENNVTVTHTIQATQSIMDTISCPPAVNLITINHNSLVAHTRTVVINSCAELALRQTSAVLKSPCVTSTISTVYCSNDGQAMTPSPPVTELQLNPTTVTVCQQSSCRCGTPKSSGVIFPSVPANDYQTTICKAYNVAGTNMAHLHEILDSIVNKLTLDTRNLSKTVREKTSAPDHRPSSTSIGFTAILLVIVPLLLLMVFDIQHIKEDLQKSFMDIKHKGYP